MLFALFRKTPKTPKPNDNPSSNSSAGFAGFGVKTLEDILKSGTPLKNINSALPPQPTSSRSAPSSPKRKLDEVVDEKYMHENSPIAKRRDNSPTIESVTSTFSPSLNPLPVARSTEASEEEDIEIDIVGDCEPTNLTSSNLPVAILEQQSWNDADEEDMKRFGLLDKTTVTEAFNEEDEKELSQWLSD